MIQRIRHSILLIALIACSYQIKSQDIQLSQFYSNSLYIAPSFAGLTSNTRFSVGYREQWPNISNGYRTITAGLDHYFEKLQSGVGVLALYDQAGTGQLNYMNLALQYSFDFVAFSKVHVRPGIYFSYVSRSIDFYRLTWRDQMDPDGNSPDTYETPTLDRADDVDFGASVLAYSERYWFGFSADHLLKPNQSLYYFEQEEGNEAFIPIKYSLFGGTKFTAAEKLLRPVPTTLQLAFLYKNQGKFNQLDLGMYWYRYPLVLGIWYRGIPIIKSNSYNDAIILLLGIKTRDFNIGYSYDFTTSKLVNNTGGSHEISITYSFKTKKHKKKLGMVPCPEF